jgi:hypothetical protein
LNFQYLPGLQTVDSNLNRRAHGLGPGAWFPGLDERDSGKTRSDRAHDRGCGNQEPAPFCVHAITWHLLLQMDENPAGSVCLSYSKARILPKKRRSCGQISAPSPHSVVKRTFYPKEAMLNNGFADRMKRCPV